MGTLNRESRDTVTQLLQGVQNGNISMRSALGALESQRETIVSMRYDELYDRLMRAEVQQLARFEDGSKVSRAGGTSGYSGSFGWNAEATQDAKEADMDDERSAILETQVTALTQSLLGLAGATHNWSACLDNFEGGFHLRYELLSLILSYCSPCSHLDVDLASLCATLQSLRSQQPHVYNQARNALLPHFEGMASPARRPPEPPIPQPSFSSLRPGGGSGGGRREEESTLRPDQVAGLTAQSQPSSPATAWSHNITDSLIKLPSPQKPLELAQDRQQREAGLLNDSKFPASLDVSTEPASESQAEVAENRSAVGSSRTAGKKSLVVKSASQEEYGNDGEFEIRFSAQRSLKIQKMKTGASRRQENFNFRPPPDLASPTSAARPERKEEDDDQFALRMFAERSKRFGSRMIAAGLT